MVLCYAIYIYRLSFVGSVHSFLLVFTSNAPLFFSPPFLYRSIGLFYFFCAPFHFLVLSYCTLFRFNLSFFFICHRHRCTTVACRTLSRFDSSLVFFMLFQFNGYFLLLLLECWKIATYFNQKQKMGKKNWNRPNLNQYFFYVCRAHQFFFLGLWTFTRLWPLIRNQQLQ